MKGRTVQSINPATEEVLSEHQFHSASELERRLSGARSCHATWKRSLPSERCRALKNLAAVLRASIDDCARAITLEMGKPIFEAEAEVEKCAACADHFAECSLDYLKTEARPSDSRDSYVRTDPLGVILAIMPWNFPYWQLIRAAVPALAAGNVCIAKPASNVIGCSLKLEGLFERAGFPPGAFQLLLVPGSETKELVRRPEIDAVTLTGSETAGSEVASTAGAALKKVVLELGGSDPFIVLEDADIEAAAQIAAKARCINSGQSCIAAKRFIIVSGAYERFEAAFVREMKRYKVGDPLDRGNQVGPLARGDLRSGLHSQVQDSIKAGARPLLGAGPLLGRGYFYSPAVLAGVLPGMRAFDEETFGPVAALVEADSEKHAIELANRSSFGLGASLWTRDIERAKVLAGELQSGMVFINGLVKSDPRLPFGGIKRSGFGRELSRSGIREFVNEKTVWVG